MKLQELDQMVVVVAGRWRQLAAAATMDVILHLKYTQVWIQGEPGYKRG